LIHGFGGDLDSWLFNIDALAEYATVYAIDLPGHGQSYKALHQPSISALADLVRSFMNRLKIDAAHLVGHSMGGAIALALASSSPKHVKSVTLIAPAGLGAEFNADYIKGFVAARSRREIKPVLELLFADPGLVRRQLIEDVLKYKRLDGVAAALDALSKVLFGDGRQSTILIDNARILDVPLLVIWGEQDKIIPASQALALKGSGKIEIIGGAGHMVQMEAASRVNELLKRQILG
jgi:pyruvate dehydrogenase E2 component (dihydrolipoamide acetyltransferase)